MSTPSSNSDIDRKYTEIEQKLATDSILAARFRRNLESGAPLIDFERFKVETFMRHILDVGSTGSGKTNDSFHLAKRAFEQGLSVLIVDPKAEYRSLASEYGDKLLVLGVAKDPPLLFNPLQPAPQVTEEVWISIFADVFTRSYGLSEPSRRIIQDSLEKLYSEGTLDNRKIIPTPRELEEEVSKFPAGSPRELNSRRSLENRLHIINTGIIGDTINTPRGYTSENWKGRITVLELDRIGSLRDQRFLVEMVIASLWENRRHAADSETTKWLVVLEEAHRFVSEERPPASRGDRTLIELAIAEARRYGIGFLILDQLPLLLSSYVRENCGTVLLHRLSSRETAEQMCKLADVRQPATSSYYGGYTPESLLTLPEGIAILKPYIGNYEDVTRTTYYSDLRTSVTKIPRYQTAQTSPSHISTVNHLERNLLSTSELG
ncbi:MAG: ATP-binding protein [Nitrososphaerota archaeon]|nr:ATP-binding protein [Nitrososphaerota archaeon]